MCLEDIILGREMPAGFTELVLDGTDQPLLPQNPFRTALILTPPSAGKVTYHYGSSVAFGAGIVMCAGESPLILEIGKHGQLVTRAWRAIGLVGDGPALDTWTEVGVGEAVAATATHAAVPGQAHLITDIWIGADDAALANEITWTHGATVVNLSIQSSVGSIVSLKAPLRGLVGELASITVGNIAATSRVMIGGYSIGTSEGFGTIVVYEASLNRKG